MGPRGRRRDARSEGLAVRRNGCRCRDAVRRARRAAGVGGGGASARRWAAHADSGIGTSAALDNPRCVLNDRTEPYGRFDWTSVADGPVCVKPWDDGDNNGGATYQGVTADRVKVVVILPNEHAARRAVTVVTHGAGEPRRQHRRHTRGLGARLPAAVDAVVRDVGP